jgi:hypothetical protein
LLFGGVDDSGERKWWRQKKQAPHAMIKSNIINAKDDIIYDISISPSSGRPSPPTLLQAAA